MPEPVLPLVESCLREEPGERPTPREVVAAAGHDAGTLQAGVWPGWFTGAAAPEPSGGGERWVPAWESAERESRVEYVAPVTLTDVPASESPGVPPSRLGLLRAAVGGAAVVAGAGTGGWLWLRDRGDDKAGATGSSAGPRSTGVRWEYGTGGLGGRGACAALSPDGSRLYVGGMDGALHAVSPKGRKLWSVELSRSVMSPLATADGAYCLTAENGEGAAELYAVDPRGGVRWKRTIDGGGSQSPVAAGDFVLVTTGTESKGSVRAYAPDGSVAWEAPTPAGPTSEPAVAGGSVYVGTFGKRLVALDAKDGTRSWAVRTGGNTGRPTRIGDTLVVASGSGESGSEDMYLHGFSLAGKQLWKTSNDDIGGGRYFTSARFGDLAVTSGQGSVVALNPAAESTSWIFKGGGDASSYSDPTHPAGAGGPAPFIASEKAMP
ncbi:PQQ-binding-like beta-propeller repeat protein [Streptomyces sp. NPDC050564]|uniref:outer membrane protein assembly factor BamB family protein n=1 Tax=Streptomyces sp. NPDC050564 TaxID=3365631 RepID=UPI0037A180F8